MPRQPKGPSQPHRDEDDSRMGSEGAPEERGALRAASQFAHPIYRDNERTLRLAGHEQICREARRDRLEDERRKTHAAFALSRTLFARFLAAITRGRSSRAVLSCSVLPGRRAPWGCLFSGSKSPEQPPTTLPGSFSLYSGTRSLAIASYLSKWSDNPNKMHGANCESVTKPGWIRSSRALPSDLRLLVVARVERTVKTA